MFPFITMYLIQFVFAPLFFIDYYPESKVASIIFIITLIVCLLYACFISKYDAKDWILNDLIYLLLIYIYHGPSFYGIGIIDKWYLTYNLKTAITHIICIGVILSILEIVMINIRRYIKKKQRKIKKRKQ